jgi:carbamoyl-phosphate synthase large subunit
VGDRVTRDEVSRSTMWFTLMNLLFLNAGRRAELIELFRDALVRQGGGRLYGSDLNPLAPALQVVDEAFIFPHGDSPAFAGTLLQFCIEKEIRLVVPTIDPDLVRLDRIRAEFADKVPRCHLLIPSSECIELARNKKLAKARFARAGIPTARTLDANDSQMVFPVFVRPLGGSAGEGARRISNRESLASALQADPGLLIEEYIDGDEITVDVLTDLSGRFLIAIPRRRIRVRGGEVVQGVLERSDRIEALAREVAAAFQPAGPLTVQFLRTKEGSVYATEVNARMGGGLPLTVAAGADWCGWILDMVRGQPPDLTVAIRDRLFLTRCDRSFFLTESEVRDLEKQVFRR